LVRSASFSESCIVLRYGGNCGGEEGGPFIIGNDLDVVVPWVFLVGLLTPWFVAGNRTVPDCAFFRRPHVSVIRSFFNAKLWNVNIRSLRGGDVVGRDSSSFQFP